MQSDEQSSDLDNWRSHELGGGHIPRIGEALGFADGWWVVTGVDQEGFNYKPMPTCPTCGQWTEWELNSVAE